MKYAELLREKMNTYNVPCYLVNTGWIGANASSGAKRISLPITRKIIHLILDGTIESSKFTDDPYFGVSIPAALDGIDENVLHPLNAWSGKDEYDETAKQLVYKFQKNFEQYDIEDQTIISAGPRLR